MVTKFIHNISEEDITVEWDSKPQLFRAETITELSFQDEEADGMVEHYVRNGAGNLKEVTRDEANKLTGGVVGKQSAKSAKVKSSAPAGTEETKEPEAPKGGEGTEETEAKPQGRGK